MPVNVSVDNNQVFVQDDNNLISINDTNNLISVVQDANSIVSVANPDNFNLTVQNESTVVTVTQDIMNLVVNEDTNLPSHVDITIPTTQIVEIITSGPQGPPGPQGLPGTGSIDTGSLLTTASFNAYTGSNTSQFAGTASYALTASYLSEYVSPFPYTGSALITGSLGITGSVTVTNALTSSNIRATSAIIAPIITYSNILSTNGGEMRLAQSTIRLNNSSTIQWSDTSDSNQTRNIGLRRYTTGTLEVYDGTTNTGLEANRRDLLARTLSGSSLYISGSSTMSGSLNITQGITGSLFGTASYAATASNILGGKATHVPFFITDTTLATSSIFQSGSYSVIINQDNNTVANPEALYVWQPSTTSFNVISGKGNLNNYLQLNIHNTNQGTNASSDVVATANNGDETSNYIDMGINSQNFSGDIGGVNDAYLYSTGRHLHIGNASNYPLQFFAGGLNSDTNRKLELRPDNSHNITGSLEISGSLVVNQGITGSLFGTASYAETASYAPLYLPLTGGTINGNVTVNGTASISFLNVQYESASVIYSSGSNIFGDATNDTQTLIGTVLVSGSQRITGSLNVSQGITGSLFGTASYVTGSIFTDNNPALSSSYALSASYALTASQAIRSLTASYVNPLVQSVIITGSLITTGSNKLIGDTSLTGSLNITGSTLQVGNNTLIGNTILSGSIGISGSSTIQGTTTMTGSLLITGSTTQVGNNTLLGDTLLSGSITISGSFPVGSLSSSVNIYGDTAMTGYLKFNPYSTNIDTSISASYIYVSGSTNDLYFSQNGNGYANTTRLRWLEGNLYTGLLHGGILGTLSSTVFTVSSGSGIIVALNGSYSDDPYPTVQYLNWGNMSASIAPLSASADWSFVAINSASAIEVKGTPYEDGEYNTKIPLGLVLHQNRSTINGVQTFPSLAYGWKQRSFDFMKAFGPLKISGYELSPSGSSTGGLVLAGGISWVDGRNYTINPNNPSYITEAVGIATSKIFRYHQSGSQWVYNTNGGAGYTSIDPSQYSNSGSLTPVPTNDFTIQRVYYFPNSATKALFVYYGNATYSTVDLAKAAISTEAFSEAPNTAANAIFIGYMLLRHNADFTVAASYAIQAASLFRAAGGSGGGGGGGGTGTSITLQTNGTNNGSQTTLNLKQGSNVTLSDDGVGGVTISSIGSGGSGGNAATSSYGSFYSTATQLNGGVGTSNSMSFNNTDISNGVSISGSGNTKIKIATPGEYDIQFSAQVNRSLGGTTTQASIWLSKNGLNVSSSNTTFEIPGGTSNYTVAAWNWFVAASAGDYYEIKWASSDANLQLVAVPTPVYGPDVPSVILTVNRVDIAGSNTGSFQGSFSGSFTGSISNAISASYATTASYVTGSIFTGSNLAASASYSLTASYALNAGGATINTGSLVTTASFNSYTGSSTSQFAGTASYALTASYLSGYISPFPYTGSALITGSLGITGSLSNGSGSISTGDYSHAEGGGYLLEGIPLDISNAESIIINGVSVSLYTSPETYRVYAYGDLTSFFPAAPFPVTSLSITLLGGVDSGTVDISKYPTAIVSDISYDPDMSITQITLATNPLQQVYYEAVSGTNVALGNGSHAEGVNTVANGDGSHAEGRSTTSTGNFSHTEGASTFASGYASHAEGFSTIASGSYQHVQGQFNIESSAQSAFIHGNGTSDLNRSNLIFASESEVQITGSLSVSGSITGAITGSLFGTASYATTASYVIGGGGGSGAGFPYSGSAVITGSLLVSGSGLTVTGSLRVSGSITGSLLGTASNAQTASFALSSSNFVITNTLRLDNTLTDYTSTYDVGTVTLNLVQQATGSYTSAFLKYTLFNGTNARAGEFVTVWNGATVSYYDNSTTDIGDTSPVTFESLIDGSNQIQINAVPITSGWTVRALATFI